MATEFQGQRFCQQCRNMLYAEEVLDNPRENVRGSLYYRCKTKDEDGNQVCEYQERAAEKNEFENCVYRQDMEAKALALNINPDIVDDPTLQKRKIKQCKTAKCNNKEVVTFYHITHEKLDLVYVCTGCKFAWRMREKDPDYDMHSDSSDEDKRD